MNLTIKRIEILEVNIEEMSIMPYFVSKRYFRREMERINPPNVMLNKETGDTVYLAKKVTFEPRKGLKGLFLGDKMVVDFGDLHIFYSPLFLLTFRRFYGELMMRVAKLEKDNLELRHFATLEGIKIAKEIVVQDERILRDVMGLPEDIEAEEGTDELRQPA